MWDPATGQCESTLEGHSHWVRSIAWSPDGSRLASASDDKTVRIWDSAVGQCLLILEGHSGLVLSIAWSQDGSRLTLTSDDKTVRIWDPAIDKCGSNFHSSISDWLAFDNPFDKPFDHLFDNLYDIPSDVQFDGIYHLPTSPSRVYTPPTFSVKYIPQRYALNNDHSWITYDGANLLWLPTEYRPSVPALFAISTTTLAIGCSPGRVIFLALPEQISIAASDPIPFLYTL